MVFHKGSVANLQSSQAETRRTIRVISFSLKLVQALVAGVAG